MGRRQACMASCLGQIRRESEVKRHRQDMERHEGLTAPFSLGLSERGRSAAEAESCGPLRRESGSPLCEIRSQRSRFSERPKRRRLYEHAAGDRVDRALAAPDGYLTKLRDTAGIAEHGVVQGGLDPPIDQADGERLVRLDPPPGVQEVLRPRGSDEFNKTARFRVSVNEAE